MTAVSQALMSYILASLRRDGPGTFRELADRVGRHEVSVNVACRHLFDEARIRPMTREERGQDGRHPLTKVWALAGHEAPAGSQADAAADAEAGPDTDTDTCCETQVFEVLMDGPSPAAALASVTGYSLNAVYGVLRDMAARGEVEAIDPTDVRYPAGRERGRVWAVVRCAPAPLAQPAAITRGCAS